MSYLDEFGPPELARLKTILVEIAGCKIFPMTKRWGRTVWSDWNFVAVPSGTIVRGFETLCADKTLIVRAVKIGRGNRVRIYALDQGGLSFARKIKKLYFKTSDIVNVEPKTLNCTRFESGWPRVQYDQIAKITPHERLSLGHYGDLLDGIV